MATAVKIPLEAATASGGSEDLGQVLHNMNVHHIDFYRRNQQRRFLTWVSLAALPLIGLLFLWLW
jgi:hypothetical protein